MIITYGTSEYVRSQMKQYDVVKSLINQELTGLFKTETLVDMADIIKMYRIYEKGAEFPTNSTGDFQTVELRSKITKELIDKETRFLFSVTPDIKVESKDPDDEEKAVPNQELLKEVLKQNKFSANLVRGAKDYLIGKRIAIMVNVNENGIGVSFIPSLEFIYETDPSNVNKLTKFIQYYYTIVSDDKLGQRLYCKKYWLENGKVYLNESLYNGNAQLVEEIIPDTETRFREIPVAVVINDGLLGDPFGVSEVAALEETESEFSRLSSKDLDSLKKGMDSITVLMDVNPRTTANLSRAAGALWDLSSDPASEGKTGSVTPLNTNMGYSTALDTTLTRLKTSMFSSLDVPNTSNEALQGVITSGKAMQAVYWGLITRCNEKMLDWKPAFESMIDFIMQSAILYPEFMTQYNLSGEITEDYLTIVENNYPIMQDDLEERASDLADVAANAMSRKSYLIKWRDMTDDEADAELNQIIEEMQMFNQVMMAGMPTEGEITEDEEKEDEEPQDDFSDLDEEQKADFSALDEETNAEFSAIDEEINAIDTSGELDDDETAIFDDLLKLLELNDDTPINQDRGGEE